MAPSSNTEGEPMRLAFWCFALVSIVAIADATAHHSASLFQPPSIVLKGTVRDFQWHNPHCYIQLLVPNDKGGQDEWSLEMGAPLYLYNLGWRPNSLKPGDALSVSALPLRNGEKGALVLEVSLSDGRKLGATAK
jgi:hypothetical protein